MNETIKVLSGKTGRVFAFLAWLSRVAGRVTLGDIANYKKVRR